MLFMNKLLKKILECDHKVIAGCLVAAFILSLIPVLYLSGYVHATGDDYGYGARTHAAWLESRSLWQTLKAAAATSEYYWYGWQGTWFTIFLMALQPEVFSSGGYWIVPWLMLGLNIFATSLLLHYLMVKRMRLPSATWLCADMLLLLSMIQFMPSTKSGIFWYNGAAHYIVPYFLALLAVYSFFRFEDTQKKRFLFLACVCMFCLGGSSYLAPLFALIVLVYLLMFRSRKEKHLFWLVLPGAIELTGLCVSFLSPGNKKRGGEEFGFHWMLAVRTILCCFKEGVLTVIQYVREYPLIFLCLFVAAVLIFEAFCRQENPVRFPKPVLFVGLMFCLYCAMFAPGIYAGVEVSGGVPNTIFQIFLLTLLADIVYVAGWAAGRCRQSGKRIEVIRIRCVALPFLALGLVLLYGQKGTLKSSTFYECYEYIASGQADDYKAQMEERLAILLDPSQKEAELPAMNSDQGPLMHMEVMEDPEEWTNSVVRQFYQKDRVVRVPRQ